MYLWVLLFAALVVGLSVLRISLVYFAVITLAAIAALLLATAPKLRPWHGGAARAGTGQPRSFGQPGAGHLRPAPRRSAVPCARLHPPGGSTARLFLPADRPPAGSGGRHLRRTGCAPCAASANAARPPGPRPV